MTQHHHSHGTSPAPRIHPEKKRKRQLSMRAKVFRFGMIFLEVLLKIVQIIHYLYEIFQD